MVIDIPKTNTFLPEKFIERAKEYEANHLKMSKARYVIFDSRTIRKTIEEPQDGYHTFELSVKIQNKSVSSVLDTSISIANELKVNGFQLRDASSVICAMYWNDQKWILDIRNHSYKNELTKYQRNKLHLVDFLCRI